MPAVLPSSTMLKPPRPSTLLPSVTTMPQLHSSGNLMMTPASMCSALDELQRCVQQHLAPIAFTQKGRV